jgi:hypothetical protein
MIGCVNQAVFSASRGQVVLYRFHGTSGASLTITGPAAPVGETVSISYLPDGDDYVVLATETSRSLAIELRAATSATIGLASQDIPVDIIALADKTERAILLKRLLKQVSMHERHEVIRLRQVPIARLTPHCKPAFVGPVAFSRGRT